MRVGTLYFRLPKRGGSRQDHHARAGQPHVLGASRGQEKWGRLNKISNVARRKLKLSWAKRPALWMRSMSAARHRFHQRWPSTTPSPLPLAEHYEFSLHNPLIVATALDAG